MKHLNSRRSHRPAANAPVSSIRRKSSLTRMTAAVARNRAAKLNAAPGVSIRRSRRDSASVIAQARSFRREMDVIHEDGGKVI